MIIVEQFYLVAVKCFAMECFIWAYSSTKNHIVFQVRLLLKMKAKSKEPQKLQWN